MFVTVNSRYLASVQADVLAGRYACYELSIPCDVFCAGANVVECLCDTEAMVSWSLAVDFGSGPAHSQVSVNAGRKWTADHIGISTSVIVCTSFGST